MSSKKKKFSEVSNAPPPPPQIRGSGYIPRKSQRANFDHWNRFPVLTFNQCLMLLLGIEPGTRIRDRVVQNRYDELWELVESSRSAGTLVGRYPYHQDIEPYKFIEWAESVGEAIPEGWRPVPARKGQRQATMPINPERSEAGMMEVGSILFYPLSGGRTWMIGYAESAKAIGQVKGFKDIAMALRHPGKNVLGEIAPQGFTPTFSEQKAMDGKMADEISREISELTESIQIARDEGDLDELQKYEADLGDLMKSRPDSRERLNSGDAMISLTNSIRSRRSTAIRKIRKEFGDNIASQFEAYKVGNRYATYSSAEPETKWILDPPKS